MIMDELIKQMSLSGDAFSAFTVWDALFAMMLSFGLSLVIAYMYRVTHKGVSYSQSFVHNLVIMSVVVAVVMLIIGSNIARAFSLVGALSIIRFRNAVKDSRDVGFLFLVMAIGMACGTRFYTLAIEFTFLMVMIIYFLNRFNIGAKHVSETLLKIQLSESIDYHKAFDKVFHKFLEEETLLSVDSVGKDLLELVYVIRFRKKILERDFIEALRVINQNSKVALIKGQQNINI